MNAVHNDNYYLTDEPEASLEDRLTEEERKRDEWRDDELLEKLEKDDE